MALSMLCAHAPFSSLETLGSCVIQRRLSKSSICSSSSSRSRNIAVCSSRSRGRRGGQGGNHPDPSEPDPPEAREEDEEGFGSSAEPDLEKASQVGRKAKVNGVATGSAALLNRLQSLSEKYSYGRSNSSISSSSRNSEATASASGDEEDNADGRSDGGDKVVAAQSDQEDKATTSGEQVDNKSEARKVDKDDESFNLDLELLALEDNVIQEPRLKMTLKELLDEARVVPTSVEGEVDVVISGIQHDSRQVTSGDMFVCVVGMNADGHNFVNQAAEQGAAVVVASREVEIGDSVKAVVMVSDTRSILSALASAFYRRPSENLALVGITGTNGKTTTSYLLRSMYETMGLKTGLIGTIAYYIHGKHKQEASHTTPDAVQLQKLMATMVHNGTEVCIMEVSSHALKQDRCREVDFDVAVFTNLSRDHMDFHQNEEEYKQVKGQLFASMVDPGRHRKVVNIDDPNASYFVAQGNPKVPVITYGFDRSADVYPLDIQLTLFETNVLLRTPRGNIEISSGLLGRHNVYNILAAVAVGVAVEAPLEDIVRGIEEVDSVPGRVELVDEEQAFAVIVDYAHTPDALSRLLDTVRECGPKRIITVVGCGGDRDKGKRPVMAKIASDKSEVCIFTSDNPRTEDPLEILDDMMAGVGWSMDEYLACGEKNYYPPIWNGNRVFVYDLRKIAIRVAIAMGQEGDAVVVAGKGHERHQIIKNEKKFHDDREECREALLHLDMLHASGIDTSEVPWKLPGHKL